MILAEKKLRPGDKNHCLGDGEEGRWGWRKQRGSSKDNFYDDPKQNELPSAALQLGKLCKPAAVVLHLCHYWETYRASTTEKKESHKELDKVLCNP